MKEINGLSESAASCRIAGEVFESIFQGRPDGMPAWGGRISNDQIWMLTAYVRSLPTKDLSTENFTGRTVERTGH